MNFKSFLFVNTKYMFRIGIVYVLLFVGVVGVGRAEDGYEKKTYLFIPWGSETNQLPLFQQQQGSHWLRLGPSCFVLGKDGEVYIADINNEQKQIIKGFKPNGEELGMYDPELQPNEGIGDFTFDDGKIIFLNVNNGDNEVVELTKDVKLYKKNKISDEFGFDSFAKIENGMVCHQVPLKKSKNSFVFDEDTWTRKGKPPYFSKQRYNYRFNVRRNNTNGNWDIVIERRSPDNNFFSDPIVVYQNPSRDEVREYWHDVDKYGNFYSAFLYTSRGFGQFLIKVSASGKFLYRLNLPERQFVSGFRSFQIPVTIDEDGNIYSFEANSKGLDIEKWNYLIQ
jgi:hypothetical protein